MIVVIAILAAISIIAYNGIQDRANDAAVQSDLKNIGQKIQEFQILNEALPNPANSAHFSPMSISVSRSAYGNHYVSGGGSEYNLLYCRPNPPATFVLVAASRSGNVFAFNGGAVRPGVGPLVTGTTACANNGAPDPSLPGWFYHEGAWREWVN